MKKHWHGMILVVLGLTHGVVAQEAPVASETPAVTAETPAAQEEVVIARVGDETITATEFARELHYRMEQIKAQSGREIKPDLAMRRALMNELIQDHILSITARNAGIEVTDEEIESEFQQRKTIFDSEQAYQGYLEVLKLTEEKLKEHMRTQIRVQRFVEGKTASLTASDEEVTDAYALLKSQGNMTRTKDTRDLQVIMLRAKGGTDESWVAAEERAKAAKARVDGGEAFDDVAKEVSEDPNTAPEGGKLLEMPVGSFYPELEAAMKDLEAGQVSDPIRSVMGWYLISIIQLNTPGTVPIEKVANRIKLEVLAKKRQEVVGEIVKEAQKLIRVEMAEKAPTPSDVEGSQ